MKTHYQTLNLSNNASQEEIKASYRKLAMAHHPDRGGDAEVFKSINTAYSVLSNETTRMEYDESINQRTRANPFSGFGSWAQYFQEEMERGSMGGRSHRSPVQTVAIEVELKDILVGKAFSVSLNGTPVMITVPKMFPHGEKIIMPGMAARVYGDQYTDLHVVVRWKLPPGVSVSGLDVYYSIEISVLSLIFGGDVKIDLVDNTSVEITIAENTKPNTTMRVIGRGLKANSGEVGNMFVQITATMPKPDDALYVDLKSYLATKAS